MAFSTANPPSETWGDTGGNRELDVPHRTAPASGDRRSQYRKLQGLGLRLSWPNAGDARRAVVGKSPSQLVKKRSKDPSAYVHDTRIVHVSHRDVEMHYHFTSSVPNGFAQPSLEIPLAWNSVKLEVGHKDLFHYFQYAASRSLAIFGHDTRELANALVRIALASNTNSATAVLQSLLALSALHRYNVHSQAVELKISAINALSAASGSAIGTTEAIQHVATGMLLCSFEIHQLSCTSDAWTWYLRGVKDVIQAAGLDKSPQDGDLAILLDWVYYYDVLARFSQRHWQNDESTGNSSSASLASSSVASSPSESSLSGSSTPPSVRAEVSRAAPPALALIELLSEVCDAVSARLPLIKSPDENDDYKTYIRILDWRIRSLLPVATADDTNPDGPLIMELYQLSMLVYLNRASENQLNQGARTQQQIHKAFSILGQLGSCTRQFPVFILGCEARSDEQRAVVLDLISRTENDSSSRSFNYVRLLLQAIWAQDDLAVGEINYWDKLSYVISSAKILPTFV